MTAPHAAEHGVECGWAGCGLGGDISGDAHVIAPLSDGVRLAVVDGLGHGPEAAKASRMALEVIRERLTLSVCEVIVECSAALKLTRGAVLTLVELQPRARQLTWCGVGNVDAVVFRREPSGKVSQRALSIRGGVIGYRLPSLHSRSLPLLPNDVLVLATDGIRSNFTAVVNIEESPQQIADLVLERANKGTDDAHVLVARYHETRGRE